MDKIRDDTERLTRVEVDSEEGAKVGIVSYGISARSAAGAVRIARAEGQKIDHLRLISVFPFRNERCGILRTGSSASSCPS